MVLSPFRRPRPRKNQLHREHSLAYTDLCLCGGVASQSFQRWSSRLRYGFACLEGARLERNADAEGEKAKQTGSDHTILEIPLAGNSPSIGDEEVVHASL